jgi:uncharacterized protein YecE (DUF72 family)
MPKKILIGTSGWRYTDWIGPFYPHEMKSYEDLRFYATQFNTVENNSSFYRMASLATYKTWHRVTGDDFTFSLKMNKVFTHTHRLVLDDERKRLLQEHFQNLQVLKHKLGCILIQTPPSLKYDLSILETFLKFLTKSVKPLEYKPDFAIEFRNKNWFTDELYALLKKYNIAFTIAQSSRYPFVKVRTADFLYIRFHGPKELFASLYSHAEMDEWKEYIDKVPKAKKAYVYFNNDFYAYAIDNARYLIGRLL